MSETRSGQHGDGVRYHAMDALRGIAMLLGVVLHGVLVYCVVPIKGVVWPGLDPGAGWADLIFWWLHVFRIPAFFLVAGFFALMLIERRGMRAYLRHRVSRIGLPMVLAAVTLLPLLYLIWSWGMVEAGELTWRAAMARDFDEASFSKSEVMGSAHLWFLLDLLIYCIAFGGLVWAWRVLRGGGPERDESNGSGMWRSPVWLMLCLVGAAAVLVVWPGVYLEFHNQWLPRGDRLAYHATFFMAGAWLYGRRDLLVGVTRWGWSGLIVGNVAFGLVFGLMLNGRPDLVTMDGGGVAVLFAVGVTLAAWGNVVGWLGVLFRFFDRHRPVMRYLSDSAYWIYLVHLPIVMLLQVVVVWFAWPPWLDALVVITVASLACLISFEWIGRVGVIGRLLNGPRAPRERRWPWRRRMVAPPPPVSPQAE